MNKYCQWCISVNLVRLILDSSLCSKSHENEKKQNIKKSVPINHVLYEMSIFGEECNKTIRQISSYCHECNDMMC